MDSFLWPLALGLLLVVKGGDLFVTASLRAAGLLRMPQLVVGSSVGSGAATDPGLVVSVIAAGRDLSGTAAGQGSKSSPAPAPWRPGTKLHFRGNNRRRNPSQCG